MFHSFAEEVPLYTPKGKRQLAAASPYPPVSHIESSKFDKLDPSIFFKGWHPTAATASTATKNKSDKPKPAVDKIKIKEKKDARRANDVDSITEKVQAVKLVPQASASIDADPTIELSKKLKRLRRKLRESEILAEKIKSGEVINPEKDQIEKLENCKKFEKEIEKLEAERLKMRQLKVNKSS